jgi:hypothetical protein
MVTRQMVTDDSGQRVTDVVLMTRQMVTDDSGQRVTDEVQMPPSPGRGDCEESEMKAEMKAILQEVWGRGRW